MGAHSSSSVRSQGMLLQLKNRSEEPSSEEGCKIVLNITQSACRIGIQSRHLGKSPFQWDFNEEGGTSPSTVGSCHLEKSEICSVVAHLWFDFLPCLFICSFMDKRNNLFKLYSNFCVFSLPAPQFWLASFLGPHCYIYCTPELQRCYSHLQQRTAEMKEVIKIHTGPSLIDCSMNCTGWTSPTCYCQQGGRQANRQYHHNHLQFLLQLPVIHTFYLNNL